MYRNVTRRRRGKGRDEEEEFEEVVVGRLKLGLLAASDGGDDETGRSSDGFKDFGLAVSREARRVRS